MYYNLIANLDCFEAIVSWALKQIQEYHPQEILKSRNCFSSQQNINIQTHIPLNYVRILKSS